MAKHRRDRRSRGGRVELRPRARKHKSGFRSALWGLGYLSLVVGVFAIVYLVRFNTPEPQALTDKAQADPPVTRSQDQTDIDALTAAFTALDDTQLSSEERDRALRQEQLAVAQHLAKTLPQNANALFILAMAYQEQGESVRASQYLEQCLQRQPGRADALDQLGRIAQQGGEHDRAVDLFQKTLEQDPGLAGVHYRLAEALKFQGELAQALTELAKHTALHPQAPGGYSLQGEIHLQLQDYEQAKQNYEKAIELDPQQARPYFGLATACARLGLKAEAGEYRRKFKELEIQAQDIAKDRRTHYDPLLVTRQSVAHTHADVARVYKAQQRQDQARMLWERARILDPNNLTSCFSLADLDLRAGRTSEALALYRQILKIQPRNGVAHFFIGHIHEKAGNLDGAESAYQKVIEVNPQRPEGYLTLIRFYQETHPNLPRAKTLAQALIKLAPQNAKYQDLYKRIQEMQ
jgi:tetratricopeptide (TPR) repeat protein